MKRILHIVGGMDRAGAETMIMNLFRNIDREKYQFDFVYFRSSKCDYDDEILELGGRIFKIKNTRNPIIRAYKLRQLINKEAPFHAVHCHMLFSNAFHILSAYFSKIPMRISHSHNTSDVNSKTFIGRLYQKFSKKIMAKYSTHFIACGEKAGEFLFPKTDNINYLLNAIDVKSFCDNRKISRNYLKEEFNLDNDTIIITQIGRLAPVKNHKFTIEFSKYLKSKKVNFKVFIVGQGILEDELKSLVNENDLKEQIKFLGVRSDIPNILAGSDLMIMPSFHEGFPVVLVESQSTGVPSLIADTISPEVNLGLNLVTFASLEDDFSIWEEKMMRLIKQDEVAPNNIIEVMTQKGFNIVESAKKLEKIYG